MGGQQRIEWSSLLITNSRERRSLDIKIIWFMETDASSIRVDGV